MTSAGSQSSTASTQPSTTRTNSAGMPWLSIIIAFVLSQAFMIACAFAWVFIYSIAIMTTGDPSHYDAYARVASPVVAVLVALPVFFLVGRWMRRYGDRARHAALMVVGLNLLLDAVVISTMAQDLTYNLGMSVLAATMKVAGAILGSRRS